MVAFTWNLLLAIAWMTLTGSFTGPNFIVGFLFGYVCLALVQNQITVLNGYAQQIPAVVLFVFYFFGQVIKSNAVVAYDVATPRLSIKPGVIAVPLELDSDVGITILANFITLTPGTLSLDVSDDRNVLFVHAMYLDDEEELIAGIKDIERRILKLMR
jgi:multicomponent Na+:H+ antiporter subunit E